MKSEQIENLPIEWKRGNGLRKSDLDKAGKNKCILYGELYTKHKNVLVDSQNISKTNKQGKVYSKKGDVLVPATSTAAKKDMLLAREVDEDGILLGGDINIIRPKQGLFAKKYLPYYFMTRMAYQQLDKYITGATGIIHISNKGLKKLKVPLSPLQEQQNIVIILDKAFAAIDTAKANAEQNLQNAKELFESYLQNTFENKGNHWEEKKIEDLSNEKKAIVSGPFGSNLKVADYREEGVPMIRLQNVGKGYFIDKSIKYVNSSKAEELKSHSFKTGDIVLAKLGIPIGKTCIIPEYFGSGIIVADIVRIRPDKKTVNYKFVEFFLNTNLSVSQLNKNISGATRPRVNLSDVRNIIIPIPEIKEQEKIVQKLNELTAQTKKLEAIYTQKIADLEEMKKAILEKAFSGQLGNIN